jgi:hypothetical protein
MPDPRLLRARRLIPLLYRGYDEPVDHHIKPEWSEILERLDQLESSVKVGTHGPRGNF